MSADSGRGSKPKFGQQVRPEPVVEKSFVESVTGFINEVAPQTYNNPSHYDGKEKIQWVKFDNCDITDFSCYRDKIETNENAPPLFIIVGYTNGVQGWIIPISGDAVEVFSWHQGPVKTLKVLSSPHTSDDSVDIFSLKRPLIAICDTAGPGPHFCSVSFISLKTGEQVKAIKFKNQVHDIHANKNVVVISFLEKLAVFDAATLEDMFTITNCFPSPGPNLNPIALGDRWLAYSEKRLYPIFQSCGGMVPEHASYKSTVFHAAKSITKSMKELGESVVSNLIGPRQNTSPIQAPSPPPANTVPGIVTIIDTKHVPTEEVCLSSGACKGVVAHFVAHHGAPIICMTFDPSGMLLATADKQGHSFHIYKVIPHPLSSVQTAVHHLYTLYRGDTTAKVIDMSFSLDSRWIAVSTHRGTTHVFPITPYGGGIGIRTHTSLCVVNRLSTFQKSAGFDDAPSSGRNSPVLSASPGTSKILFEQNSNLPISNPRYPPYPSPTLIKPLVQLRQPLFQNIIGSISSGPSPSHSPPVSVKSTKTDDIIRVASVFGSPRGWLASSPTAPREIKKRAMDALFVMAYHGTLIEYYLDPVALSTIPPDKLMEASPIELQVQPTAQWSLIRDSTSKEIRPPLESSSPLISMLMPSRQRSISPASSLEMDDPEERWMAQVEINTHTGPPRRLWMGPQFSFKAIPQTGNLAGKGYNFKETQVADPSLDCPVRSSPVNIAGTGGANLPVLIEANSLGSHDQSPRLTERYSGHFDLDTVMMRLKHDIADAMMDSPQATEISEGDPSSSGAGITGSSGDERALDLSDMMDVSFEHPATSSDRPTPSSHATSLTSELLEEELQSVTTHLSQVAVTQRTPNSPLPPIIGTRTPSLEESRGLTSSAEELSTTLGPSIHHSKIQSDCAWVPIDRPSDIRSFSRNVDNVTVERPEPREFNRIDNESNYEWYQPKTATINPSVSINTSASSTGLAWNKVARGNIKPDNGNLNEEFPSLDNRTRLIPSSVNIKSDVITTSEDDMVPVDSKRDKKKKKKKPKNEADCIEEPCMVVDFPDTNVDTTRFEFTSHEQSCQNPSIIDIDLDADHFHTAEDCTENNTEEFHDTVISEYQDEVMPMTENLEDLTNYIEEFDGQDVETEKFAEIEVEPNSTNEGMLRSIHDENDLAKALEEAYSSDDNLSSNENSTRITSRSRSERPSEMFPFRDSSAEEVEKSHVRLRSSAISHTPGYIKLHSDEGSADDKTETSGDDRGESSADDRRTTSESDVGASPNPRASSSSKGKKKKKKKR